MKRNRQIIKENYQDLDPLCSEFITWAMGDGAKSGRINPMGLLYEYYYEDNDDALLQVAEEFSDVSDYDIEEVYEAARKAANYYFHYNPVDLGESRQVSKKNAIRLTESELKQVISESVKQIISELDWKTFQNAGVKSYELAMDIANKTENANLAPHQYSEEDKLAYNKHKKRSRDFISAAKKAFDRDHGYTSDTTVVASSPDIIPTLNGVGAFKNGGKWKGRWDDFAGEYVGTNEPNIASRFYGKSSENFYNGGIEDKDTLNAYDKAKKEMKDYHSGNYQYTKGKGYHLKK